MSDSAFLDGLVAADLQGERALCSLWPQDQILHRGEWHTILSMQLIPPRSISFKTDTGRHFLWDAYILRPALLSEEHLEAEKTDQEVW